MTAGNITAADLGINLNSEKETDLFKWFLFCLLSGKPVRKSNVKNAYEELIKNNLRDSTSILYAGPDRIIEILNKSGYARYSSDTAGTIIDIVQELVNKYGSISNLIKLSGNYDQLKENLISFRGVGVKTSESFIHELPPALFNNSLGNKKEK